MNNFDKLSKYINQFCLEHQIATELFSSNCVNTYLLLYKEIVTRFHSSSKLKPFVVGINGAQGSGKSTICELLKLLLNKNSNLNVVIISIDDLYKTHAERLKMAMDIHPLFATRGVPGTHDIKLGMNLFESLFNNKENDVIKIPRFDKANDDRESSEDWYEVKEQVDIILFEGWCVGSKPQAEDDLVGPVNSLDQQQDSELIWRNFVNQQLTSEYQKLFNIINYLVFLKAPGYDCVFNWRLQQEQKLIARLRSENKSLACTMNITQLKSFMLHFERLTRHNLKTLPEYADCILALDENRNCRLIKS